MNRHIPWILGLLLALGGAAATQEELAGRIVAALRDPDRAAVHDLGGLLKPAGEAELAATAAQLARQGTRVTFVTVPPQTVDVDAVAEGVYRQLDLTAADLLVVFDGRRVYGKTLALKGEPEAFREALNEALPGFRLSPAMGLAQFARALQTRIDARRAVAAETRARAAERSRWLWGGGLAVVLLTTGVLAYPFARQRMQTRRAVTRQLAVAGERFQEATLAMPPQVPAALNTEWVRLENELARCRRGRGVTLADAERLSQELEAFQRRLAAGPEGPASPDSQA